MHQFQLQIKRRAAADAEIERLLKKGYPRVTAADIRALSAHLMQIIDARSAP